MTAQLPDRIEHLLIPRNNHSALGRGHILIAIEAEDRGVAECTRAVETGGVRSVLD